MKKKLLVLLIALVLFVPGNVFAANGTPFEELHQQIDQLKTQVGGGGIKVYDANDQFLGIYAGLLPGNGALVSGIFIPKLNLFIQKDQILGFLMNTGKSP